MDSGVYLRPYTLAEGRLELGEGLRLLVMPSYRGQGRDGKPIVDERATLVVVDAARGQWPLMAKMDAKTVQSLLDAWNGTAPAVIPLLTMAATAVAAGAIAARVFKWE